MPTDLRLQQLTDWVQSERPHANLQVASADASFRRYFRVTEGSNSWIAMDAPPEKETLEPFIDITERLIQASVNAPKIYQQSLEQGFLLLGDLGDTPYLSALNDKQADALYGDAFKALLQIQTADTSNLPVYDEALLQQEMNLMPEWFLSKHLGLSLSNQEQSDLQSVFELLIKTALDQPQVFVHRDYHSRNLMVTTSKNPGVIDYQDAVLGPVCYDLVSLLRDCYIAWPVQQVRQWVTEYRVLSQQQGIIPEVDDELFQQWFDWMGLQRHIKVLGIFARLNHRDGKAHYLNDLPLTLSYVMNVAANYPEMKPLVDIFQKYDIPKSIGTVEISQ
ncbi:aminoglycoside phosphotransferase family protein [Leucothrix pacifica]|uniref:Aminoglycoside phosphotransferase n=1 Tax=Leucothrix pacifica TaxID=1247513 RepID=A0A317CL19_9GAMM|nr:phosphotransferase [Leucothrix pacifica]PWQ97030.1 aminoglycoside phosphotransferase [Leucothrix pacifica]